MSEQQVQGAEQALDLNNELQSRREKLAGLRENGIAFPNDFVVTPPPTNCTPRTAIKTTKSWKRWA